MASCGDSEKCLKLTVCVDADRVRHRRIYRDRPALPPRVADRSGAGIGRQSACSPLLPKPARGRVREGAKVLRSGSRAITRRWSRLAIRSSGVVNRLAASRSTPAFAYRTLIRLVSAVKLKPDDWCVADSPDGWTIRWRPLPPKNFPQFARMIRALPNWLFTPWGAVFWIAVFGPLPALIVFGIVPKSFLPVWMAALVALLAAVGLGLLQSRIFSNLEQSVTIRGDRIHAGTGQYPIECLSTLSLYGGDCPAGHMSLVFSSKHLPRVYLVGPLSQQKAEELLECVCKKVKCDRTDAPSGQRELSNAADSR